MQAMNVRINAMNCGCAGHRALATPSCIAQIPTAVAMRLAINVDFKDILVDSFMRTPSAAVYAACLSFVPQYYLAV